MNVARNHIAPQTGDAPGRAGEGLSSDRLQFDELADDVHAIDWRALRSRLFATHDKLGVRGEDAAASRLRLRGSFDGCAASALSAYEPHAYEESSRPVNLDASSNGKPHTGKDNPVADVNGSGERG